ncbi:MAG TPA: cation:dicarboxylase symporter family transporter, partial [Spirochaetales bacterium]|nr:cation:dicarboxylase symporter family transporter [Spirochaetales bacterium]
DSFIASIQSIAIGITLIILYPLELFSAAIGIYELHEEKRLLKVLSRAFLYSLIFIFSATILGIVISSFAPVIRIQLGEKIGTTPGLMTIGEILPKFFPPTIIDIFVNTNFILPLFAVTLFIGLSFSSNKHAGKVMLNVFESASELLWNINSFIIEILPFLFIFIAASVTRSLLAIKDFSNYAKLFEIILIESILYIFGIIPLVIYVKRKKRNPYKILYGMLATGLSALFIPHAFGSVTTGIKHLKESLGVRRRINATTLPLTMTFGRAGTVLISTTAFIVVLSSYSQIGLTVQSIFWILLWLPITGLLSGASANLGVLSAIAFVCSIYGRGFESGFVLLLPIALPLFLIGNLLDALTYMTVAYCSSTGEEDVVEHEMRHFI